MANSVLPTPVGPAKNKIPFGFLLLIDWAAPDNPTYDLIIVCLTLLVANSCPLTFSESSNTIDLIFSLSIFYNTQLS